MICTELKYIDSKGNYEVNSFKVILQECLDAVIEGAVIDTISFDAASGEITAIVKTSEQVNDLRDLGGGFVIISQNIVNCANKNVQPMPINVKFRFASNYTQIDKAGDFDAEVEFDNDSINKSAIYEELKSTGEVTGKIILMYSSPNDRWYAFKVTNVSIANVTNENVIILDLEYTQTADLDNSAAQISPQ